LPFPVSAAGNETIIFGLTKFNSIMKITLKILSLIMVMGVAVSCSKDDEDPAPNLENVSVSLKGQAEVVTVPSAMLTSEDPNAQMAASYVEMANSIGENLAMFTPPSGATKSTTAITAVNGRTKEGAVLVYTWTDPNYGTMAYQIKDAGTKYTFELFLKPDGETDWYLYVSAEEQKDGSAGSMKLHDFFSGTGEVLMQWNWSRSGDDFTMEVLSNWGDPFRVVLEINTVTKAGSVEYYFDSELSYSMTWDAQGNGTWEYYAEGEVVESGTW
jgi:hypothetical protein